MPNRRHRTVPVAHGLELKSARKRNCAGPELLGCAATGATEGA
jgi:hypothetical protein